TPEIADDFARCVMSGGAGYTAAGMCAGAAHVQPVQRAAVVAITQHGSRGEHLVERERTVKDIPADESERALQIQRALDLAPEDCGLEVGSVLVDGVDHQVRDGLAVVVPGGPVGEL